MAALDWLQPGPDAPPLQDPQQVDRVFRRSQLSVLVGVTLGYGSAYTCRLGLSVIKKEVLDTEVFTATELGTIGSAFLFSYGLGKLINGTVADRTNVRRFWTLGLAVSAVVNLLMGATTAAWLATLLWAINGWFQGFLAPASVVAITQWLHPRERGTGYGIWSASHSLGEGLTFVGTAALAGWLGWRYAFFGPGVYCLLVAAFAYLMLRDRPEAYGLPSAIAWRGKLLLGFVIGHDKGEVGQPKASPTHAEGPPSGDPVATFDTPDSPPAPRSPAEQSPAEQSPAEQSPEPPDPAPPWRSLLANKTLWVLGTASALMYVSRYAVNNWGFLYLQTERGFSLEEASGYLALNTILGIAGSPVYGWISDRFFKSRRPPVTLLFGLIEILGLVIIFFGPRGDAVTLGVGWALYGFSLSGLIAVLGGLFAVDICHKRMAGAAMGFVGAFSYLGAGLQDVITGVLIDAGTTRSATGDAVIDFSWPVAFWFGSAVLSAVLAASLWKVQVRD